MGKGDGGRCIFPLTSLQIGDLQSYLSDLNLFLANESRKVYILVDNRPWLRDLGSRGAHIWQLMVTKSRLSPFANSKARRERKEGNVVCPNAGMSKSRKLMRWFSLIDASSLSRKRVVLPVKKLRNSLMLRTDLHRILSGFIVFEVAWTNVRGINYLNELQTDTSLAIEAKSMQRWEFDSIAQASSCIPSWFSGMPNEQLHLKEFLESAIGECFYDANDDFSRPIYGENICNDIVSIEGPMHCLGSNFGVYSVGTEERTGVPHTPPPPTGPYKRRKVMKSFDDGDDEFDPFTREINYSETFPCISEIFVEPTQYKDVLILFRFNDGDLPFKLREVIMSDLRLLTLLEAGLPTWVIFLQSYPGFCHLYRPWMCPFARTLYVLMSIVTVLIGFYDLYKNVPVLKATASRLCGPLLDWIETWEMVSRIKYLGTMLFLHNFQKAIKWFLTMTHAMRSFFSVLTQPLAEIVELFEFLLPVWNGFIEVAESIFSIICVCIGSSFNLVGNILEMLVFPLWFIFTIAWRIATSILYPVFWACWEVLYAPVRLILAVSSFVAFISVWICNILANTWRFVSGVLQLASATETTVSTYEVSMWRSLWNDLFSQIFRAVRSILNGFVAFFAACNRHRLSIYNHIKEFIQRLNRPCQRSKVADMRNERALHGTQPGRRKDMEVLSK